MLGLVHAVALAIEIVIPFCLDGIVVWIIVLLMCNVSVRDL